MTSDRLPDPVRVALNFARLLEDLGVRYVATGSLASSVHGEPRSTDDVDFVADLRPVHVEPLVASLGADWYVDAAVVADAVLRGASFNAVHYPTSVKVDVFVVGADPFDAERVERGQTAQLAAEPDTALRVDTAEHIVLRKLEWYRRGGEVSDRQWRDIIGVLRNQRSRLDQATLLRWAASLGVSDLLTRALAEAAV